MKTFSNWIKEKSFASSGIGVSEANQALILSIASSCSSKTEFFEAINKAFGDVEINEGLTDFIQTTAKNLYDKYAPDSVKDFVGKASKTFKTAHEKYSDPSNIADMEKGVKEFGSQLGKAVANAQKVVNTLGGPLGISASDMPFIISIVTAGLTGGLGAIPLALVQYFVRKQIYGGAGKLYDTIVGKAGETKAEWRVENPYIHGFLESHGYLLESQAEYLRKRELMRQRTAERIGGVAGAVTGTSKLMAVKLKQYAGQLADLAVKNRVAIGKVIFLYGIGILIGMGTAKVQDLLTKKPQDDILKSMEMMGYNKKEIEDMRELLKLSDKMVADPSSMSPDDLNKLHGLQQSASLADLAHNPHFNDPNMQKAAFFAQQGDMKQAQFWQSKAAEDNLKAFQDGEVDIKGPLTYDGPKFSPDEVAKYLKNSPTADQMKAFELRPPVLRNADFGKQVTDMANQVMPDTVDSLIDRSRTAKDVIRDIDKVIGRARKS